MTRKASGEGGGKVEAVDVRECACVCSWYVSAIDIAESAHAVAGLRAVVGHEPLH